MHHHIGLISLLVADYDEAIRFYTTKLGFVLLEDTELGAGKRWVVISPNGAQETRVLLAKAATPEQKARIGDQTGGRVFLFLYTDDFYRDFASMRAGGVVFCEDPREEPYGTVAVFQDLYGTKWDLLQPRA